MSFEIITETGIVERVDGGTARVRLAAADNETCQRCGACQEGIEGRFLDVSADGIKPGMRVKIEVSVPPVLKGVFFLLFIPLMMFVGGAVAGQFVIPALAPGLSEYRSVLSMAGAFIFLGAAVLGVFVWGRRSTAEIPPPPRIVQVLPGPGETAGASAAPEPAVFNAAGMSAELESVVADEMERIDGVNGVRFDREAGRVFITHDPGVIKKSSLREILLVLGVRLEG